MWCSREDGEGGAYRVTSLTRIRTPLGPYRRPKPRVLGGSQGVDVFLWARYPCRERVNGKEQFLLGINSLYAPVG